MSEPSTTKERILDDAEELLLEKSLESVSLNEILKAVNTPKGCFYHHFASKEEFGVELIQHYVKETLASFSDILLNRELEPNARLRILSNYEMAIARFIANEGKPVCLLMKLTSESGFSSPAMREQISRAYPQINRLLEGVVQEGIDNGQIDARQSAAETTEILSSLWTGAFRQAYFHRKSTLLRTVLGFTADVVIPAKAAE
ncbi:MAG: TetR/AcrR family transcriptional regulator [Akkermansiaceae bacterium]|nr:TetR/AcrR family transcriptional regulator [Akkermansiaceae bacterium]